MRCFKTRNKCLLSFIFILYATSVIYSQTTNKEVDSLLNFVNTKPHDTSYVKSLNSLSRNYSKLGKYNDAFEFALRAKKDSKLINYQKGVINSIYSFAIAHYYTSNYDSTLHYLNAALSICDSVVNKAELALIYGQMGYVYLAKGSFNISLQYSLRALRLNEIINNKEGIGNCNSAISVIYLRQKNYNKALVYELKSLEYRKLSSGVERVASSYLNIGNIYYAMVKYDKSLFYSFRALEIFERVDNKKSLANVLSNIGLVYYYQKKTALALTYFKKALLNFELMKSKSKISTCLLQIGMCYLDLNNIQESEKYLKEALTIALEIKQNYYLNDIYSSLSTLYEKKQDYKGAFTYQKLLTQIKDTLFNAESSKQIAEMNTKYETELKDKELIKKDAEIALQQANTEKQAIVKNGFIVGFVFLLGLIVFIYRGYMQKQKTNKLLNDKNQKITDSINYAKLIQSSILPSVEDLTKYLPNSFVYYQPKDIVSGDFYWLYPVNDNAVFFAVVDCTGHGVPGALMSMLGYSLLEQIINQGATTPSEILDKLNFLVIESLKQSNNVDAVKNGMDMALFKLDYNTYELEYAGAKNPLYIVRDKSVIELKADRKSIGLSNGNSNPFTNQSVKLHVGDQLYAFSDGYIDQKGGAENKKFYSSSFQKLLININDLNINDQLDQVKTTFVNWKGIKDQIDDVLVFGMRV